MYSNRISSQNPAHFVFLIDRSGSMLDEWCSSRMGLTLSESAAIALNEVLYDLSLNACMDANNQLKDRVHISAYAYGDDDVVWALDNLNEAEGWVKADDWMGGWSRKEEVPVSEDGGRVISRELPIWIEPHAEGSTPMCSAFRKAAKVVEAHMNKYPNSYPPIIINITDGWPTDTGVSWNGGGEYSPDWNEVRRAADEITSLSCADGSPLLLNIHITPGESTGSQSLVFPVEAPSDSHESVKNMTSISSVLPANMVLEGRKNGYDLKEGARGLILNADRALLTKFLKIGTTLTNGIPIPTEE